MDERFKGQPAFRSPTGPRFEYRLKPVAMPGGFRYHIERRPASYKYAPTWTRVTPKPVPREQATEALRQLREQALEEAKPKAKVKP